MNGMKFEGEKHRILVVVLLSAFCCFITYYFRVGPGTQVVFSHFFYVPIILASVWWKKKGLIVAALLAILLVLSRRSGSLPNIEFLRGLMRGGTFIVVAAAIGILSEKMKKAKAGLRESVASLEGIVEEKTERLRESEKLYKSLFESNRKITENSPAGIVKLNKELKVEYENPEMKRILGVPSSKEPKAMGVDVREIPSVKAAGISSVFDRLLEGKKISVEVPFTSLYGKESYLSLSGVPIFEDGEFAGAILLINDITERNWAEREIKKRQKYLESVLHNAPSAIVTLDVSHRILEWNPGAEQLFGYTRDEVLGKDVDDLITGPDVRDEATALTKHVLSGGRVLPLETVRYRKDGTPVNVILTGSCIRLGDKLQGVAAVYTGITERKRMEKVQVSTYRISEAAHSAQNIEELLHSIHGIIGELMPAKNFYIALHDATSERVSFPYFVDEHDETPAPKRLGKGLTEYVLRTGKPLLASPEVLEELVKEEEVEIFGTPGIDWLGVPLRTKEKTIGVLVVQSYTEGMRFGEEDKRILMFVSTQVAMAIERKRAEEALRESEEKYSTLVQKGNDGIVIIQDDSLKFVNSKMVELTGVTVEEAIGKPFLDFVSPAYKKSVLDMYKKKRAGEKSPNRYEIEILSKDGRKTPVGLNVSLIEFEGKPADMAIVRDITERKRTEQELEDRVKERAQELRKAQEQLLHSERLATIGQLAAGMAHELLNPLAVLQNSVYFLNAKFEEVDGKVKRHLTTMRKEIARSNKIISDLLQFSKNREPSLASTDLTQVIEEVLSKVVIPKGVKVVRSLRDTPTVMADGEQLQSVFLNLISNGTQAMPEGGTLTVRTNSDDGFVEATVSDTGIGISRENLEKIFEPLFTTKARGIGLGLAITKRLVENHGGTISVESNVNAGSVFTVKLPTEIQK